MAFLARPSELQSEADCQMYETLVMLESRRVVFRSHDGPCFGKDRKSRGRRRSRGLVVPVMPIPLGRRETAPRIYLSLCCIYNLSRTIGRLFYVFREERTGLVANGMPREGESWREFVRVFPR